MTEDVWKVLKKVGMDKLPGTNEIPCKVHLRLFIFVLFLAVIYINRSPLNTEDFGKPFADVLPNLIAPELNFAVKGRIIQNCFDLVHTFLVKIDEDTTLIHLH